VFCYVGNVFSPALDEGVGNLWTCFRQGEELVVGYALAPAFGSGLGARAGGMCMMVLSGMMDVDECGWRRRRFS
jgi:hypothetical protein